jgi:predicted  nucleic acid-binding Zn-ribbon protein
LKPKGSEINDNVNLINEVVNQIKEKHLPPLINMVKKEFYEEIQSLKQEFINFREEMWAHKAKQESINIELKGHTTFSKLSEVISGKQSVGKEGEV